MYHNNYNLRTLLKGLFSLILLVNCAGAATLNVPGDYATIQAAINAAAAGDTILVQSGTYNENVDVNKQLTLQGVGVAGGGRRRLRRRHHHERRRLHPAGIRGQRIGDLSRCRRLR